MTGGYNLAWASGSDDGESAIVADYDAFIDRKSQLGEMTGFAPVWRPDFLFEFQWSLVEWAIRKGRAAIFADCGLGKTPMQLVWAENVVRKSGGRVLILTPLAVAGQTIREAHKFGIGAARSHQGELSASIVVANYERLHYFNADDFAGVVCDESSILKHFAGATQAAVTRFMLKVPYRLLCTATAAPNDYIELGTSSEALGELGHSEMLSRFFKQSDNKMHRMQQIKDQRKEKMANHFGRLSFRVHQQIGQWRLKGHAEIPFWQWVSSWARACRKPSDLGFPDDGFVLPTLTERSHVIVPKRAPDGMLFTLPAIGLNEERDERRRTLKERCELVARLVEDYVYSMIWCHLNVEGETLERMIPYSINVQGSDDDDYKETAASWFKGEICICHDKRFSDKLAAWQNDQATIKNDTTLKIASVGLPNPLSTGESIATKSAPIYENTTSPTKPNENPVQKKNRTRSTRQNAQNMQPTLNIGSAQNPKQELGRQPIHENGLTSECENTASPLMPTIECSPVKEADAPFVEAARATDVSVASTSITATQRDRLEDCSAPTATSASANLETMPIGSIEQPCICGHKHGPRRLISKSKIFGFGLNLQHCAHVVSFASHSYEQHYQSERRCWRFGQVNPVTVDIIATEGERRVLENMERKSAAADQMFTALISHMSEAQHIARASLDGDEMELPEWLTM